MLIKDRVLYTMYELMITIRITKAGTSTEKKTLVGLVLVYYMVWLRCIRQ